MDKTTGAPRSFVFTVRVWREALSSQQFEWRGQVEFLSTGEQVFFRTWQGLIEILQSFLELPHGSED